jgi:hypothetical protein
MPKKHDKTQKIKTYKDLSQGEQPFAGFKTGEQLPLFEIPPTTASPAISQGLPKLQELLSKQGIEIGNFDDLYTAAVSIIRFVAAKEKQAILKQNKGENHE